jgi:hypothetical protein
MTVNYENYVTMPISSLQMAANSDDHWFIVVSIPRSFVRVLQCAKIIVRTKVAIQMRSDFDPTAVRNGHDRPWQESPIKALKYC